MSKFGVEVGAGDQVGFTVWLDGWAIDLGLVVTTDGAGVGFMVCFGVCGPDLGLILTADGGGVALGTCFCFEV